MVKSNVTYDEEDLKFLEFLQIVAERNLEFTYTCRDKEYRIEVINGKPIAYLNEEGTPEYQFENIDDLLEHYMIDGVPFKDIIPEIDSYGEG